MNANLIRIALFALAVAVVAQAHASPDLIGVDARFRAKIAKEKIRMSAQQRKAEEQGQTQAQGQNSASCGSQSIGNVDTGGRIGTAPREVFVFAPNAINIVGRGGC